jgi:hypothetical protein
MAFFIVNGEGPFMAMTAKSVAPSAAARQKSKHDKKARPSERDRTAPNEKRKDASVSKRRTSDSTSRAPSSASSVPEANAMTMLLAPQGVPVGMATSSSGSGLASAENTLRWMAELAGPSGTHPEDEDRSAGIATDSGSLPPAGFGIEVPPEKTERLKKRLKRLDIHHPAKVIRELHDLNLFKIDPKGGGFSGRELAISILGLGDLGNGTRLSKELNQRLGNLGVRNMGDFGPFIEKLEQAGLISVRRAATSEFLINQGDVTDIRSTDAANALFWEKLNGARTSLFEKAGISDLDRIMKVLSAGSVVTRNKEIGFATDENTEGLLKLEGKSGGTLKALREMSRPKPDDSKGTRAHRTARYEALAATLEAQFPKLASLQAFFDHLVERELATADEAHLRFKATELGKKLTFPEDAFLPEL